MDVAIRVARPDGEQVIDQPASKTAVSPDALVHVLVPVETEVAGALYRIERHLFPRERAIPLAGLVHDAQPFAQRLAVFRLARIQDQVFDR